MGNKTDFVKEITNIEEDFAKWFTDIVIKAELADYTEEQINKMQGNIKGQYGKI